MDINRQKKYAKYAVDSFPPTAGDSTVMYFHSSFIFQF